MNTQVDYKEFLQNYSAEIISAAISSTEDDVQLIVTWAKQEVILSPQLVGTAKRNLSPGMVPDITKIHKEIDLLFPLWKDGAKGRFMEVISSGASAFDAPLDKHFPEEYMCEGTNRQKCGNALRRVEDFLKSHDGTWEDLVCRIAYLNVVTR